MPFSYENGRACHKALCIRKINPSVSTADSSLYTREPEKCAAIGAFHCSCGSICRPCAREGGARSASEGLLAVLIHLNEPFEKFRMSYASAKPSATPRMIIPAKTTAIDA